VHVLHPSPINHEITIAAGGAAVLSAVLRETTPAAVKPIAMLEDDGNDNLVPVKAYSRGFCFLGASAFYTTRA